MIIIEKSREQLLSEIDQLKRQLADYEAHLSQSPISLNSDIFSQAFYINPVAMLIISRDTRAILEVNQSLVRITGYQSLDLVGKHFDKLQVFFKNNTPLLLDDLPSYQEQEITYYTRDGEFRLGIIAYDTFEQEGNELAVVSISDVTAQKLAEAELRHSREQLEQIMAASPAPICITTLDEGRYLDVNDSFLRLSGYERDEVIGKTIEDINFLVDIHRSVYVDKLLFGEPVNNMEIMVRTKSGNIGYSLLSAQLYFIDDLACVLSTVINVTERKLAEKALAESEARFHSAFHYSPTMMMITRADNGIILNANTAWLRIMGYEIDDVIGHNVDELHTWVDDDRNRVVKSIAKAGHLDNTEIRVRTKNGRIISTLSSAVQTVVNNEQCVLIYSVDITEQKRMQNELARLDRLNLVGQMAASLGHEIRNPMTTVRGFLQLLQDGNEDQEKIEYYELMIGELDQGNKIITEFLTLASDKTIDRLPVNLNSVLDQIYPLLRAEALLQEKWINYHLNDIPELWLDDKEIRQLIINLANNGLEAMSPGGYLEIATGLNGDEVILSISDQGSGIAPHLTDRIGTPFLTTKENGVGLGLAICYSIAQRHGAIIDFDSSDQGTTFRVKFKLTC